MSKILTERGRDLLIQLAREERTSVASGHSSYGSPEEDEAAIEDLTDAIEALNNLQVVAA
jgi:hypothetical protein